MVEINSDHSYYWILSQDIISFMITTGSLNSQGMISQGSSYFSEKFISPGFFCSVLSWRKFVLMYKHRFGYTFFKCLLLMLLNFTNSIWIIQLFLVLKVFLLEGILQCLCDGIYHKTCHEWENSLKWFKISYIRASSIEFPKTDYEKVEKQKYDKIFKPCQGSEFEKSSGYSWYERHWELFDFDYRKQIKKVWT